MGTRPSCRVLLSSFATILALSCFFLTPAAAECVQAGAAQVELAGGDRNGDDTATALAVNAPRDRRSGKLDKTFGTGGLVTEPSPPFQVSDAHAVVAQPDGRILLAGGDVNGARARRYDPDGSLDATFGDGGSVSFGPEGVGVEGSVVAMVLRSDGKIVVAGEVSMPDIWSRYRYVARLHPDGSLDTGFGTSGFATVGNTGPNERLDDLALQSDGKIVVGGRRSIAGWQFYLARLNEDGSPDTDFGLGGELTTSFPGSARAWVLSVLIQPDGRIVAVGDATNDLGIARYEPDGTLDAGFAAGGLLVSDIIMGPRWGGLQQDGSIVVAGSWRDIPLPYPDMAVTRFLPGGTLDTAFGEGGRARIDFDNNYDAAEAGAIQGDGKIVVGGTTYVFSAGQANIAFGLTRLDQNGGLDTQFGRGGLSYVELGEPELEAIALQPDGKILAAGTAVEQNADSIWHTWFLARFLR